MRQLSCPSTVEQQRPSGRGPEGCHHSISSAGTVGVLAEWQNVATFSDPEIDYVIEFEKALRSPMRNRELYRTTKSLRGMDGRSRRQARNDACLGRIGKFSETCTT